MRRVRFDDSEEEEEAYNPLPRTWTRAESPRREEGHQAPPAPPTSPQVRVRVDVTVRTWPRYPSGTPSMWDQPDPHAPPPPRPEQAMSAVAPYRARESEEPTTDDEMPDLASDEFGAGSEACGWQPVRPPTPHPGVRVPAPSRGPHLLNRMPAIQQEYDSEGEERLSHSDSPGFTPPPSTSLTRRIFHLNIGDQELSSTDSSYDSER